MSTTRYLNTSDCKFTTCTICKMSISAVYYLHLRTETNWEFNLWYNIVVIRNLETRIICMC